MNLRATATPEGEVLRILFMNDAVDYAIVGRTTDRQNTEWLALSVPGVGTGWIETAKLNVRLSGRYRDVLTVVGDIVGVLERPMGHFLSVPPLVSGDEVFLLETSLDGTLVKVELPTGEVGWIPFSSIVGRENTTTDDLYVPGASAQGAYEFGQGGGAAPGYFVPSAAASASHIAAPIAIVNTGNLNIRSGPGAQFSTITTVPGGTQLSTIAIASDDVWYLVAGAFGQGWINKEFALFRGNLNGLPIIPWDVAASQASIQSPIAVVSAPLVLYGAPGTQYAQVGTLFGPVEVNVVARTADFNWVQLSTSFGYGWAPASLIVLRGDAALIPTV